MRSFIIAVSEPGTVSVHIEDTNAGAEGGGQTTCRMLNMERTTKSTS